MSCNETEEHLLEFCFGAIDGPTRERIDAHLRRCTVCVASFLDVKHALDVGEDAPPPSSAARQRLRRAVEEELFPPRRRWWESAVALGFAASMVITAGVTMKKLTSGPGSPPISLQQR